MNAVVVIDPAARTAVVVSPARPFPVAVTQDRDRAKVVVKGFVGPRGPKGDPGDSSTAAGRTVVNFAYGDASPVPVFTPAFDCTGIMVRLVIDTPFDGVGASLKVGTSGNPEAFLAADDNDPSAAAGYEAAPDLSVSSGEQVILTINPGTGASKGAGRIIFDGIAA